MNGVLSEMGEEGSKVGRVLGGISEKREGGEEGEGEEGEMEEGGEEGRDVSIGLEGTINDRVSDESSSKGSAMIECAESEGDIR